MAEFAGDFLAAAVLRVQVFEVEQARDGLGREQRMGEVLAFQDDGHEQVNYLINVQP